jgi:large subunit ribosomal protein L18
MKIVRRSNYKRIGTKQRRRLRIRKNFNLDDKLRICVSKSNSNLFVQVIDDSKGVTLKTFSTFGKNALAKCANRESAKVIGEAVGLYLKDNKCSAVFFDRGESRYTGVVADVATAIRSTGFSI